MLTKKLEIGSSLRWSDWWSSLGNSRLRFVPIWGTPYKTGHSQDNPTKWKSVCPLHGMDEDMLDDERDTLECRNDMITSATRWVRKPWRRNCNRFPSTPHHLARTRRASIAGLALELEASQEAGNLSDNWRNGRRFLQQATNNASSPEAFVTLEVPEIQ